MIVRTAEDLKKMGSVVSDKKWRSARYFLKRDAMGFSLHETTVEAGSEQILWYKNHFEACIVIEGEGEIEDLSTGEVHPLFPGVAYGLDQHDRHIFKTKTRMKLICVFNPPCTGKEVHDEEGVFPLLDD